MNDLVIEDFTEFEHSKMPVKIDSHSIRPRYSIIDFVITDNYPNSDSLSYCGFGVWYDRKSK